MASGHNGDGGESNEISRRHALQVGGTAALSLGTLGVLGSTAEAAPGDFGTVVDLGEEGLSPGDEIDPYIDEYFTDGIEAHIPPGTYEWNGTLSGPSSGPSALIGDGDVGDVVFEVNDTLDGYFGHDSGTVLFRNVTFRGENPDSKAGITFSLGADGELRVEHIRAPDGGTEPEDRFLYASTSHEGVAYVRNCYWQGWGNNGAYTDNGRVIYENCVAHNNNIAGIRLGFGDGDVYNSLIVIDETPPTDGENSSNGRGIRFREPGDHVVENCDFVYRDVSGAGSPIELRASETSGEIRNCRVLNETGSPVVRNKSDDANWTAEDLHISGSGSYELEGVDAGNVVTGEDATPPRTNFEEILGAPIDADPVDSGTDGSDEDSTTDEYDHTLVLHASPDNDEPVPTVEVTVSGNAAFGDEAEADEDDIVEHDDGSTTLQSNEFDPDALDSFLFDGEVVAYDVPSGYDVDVSLDGAVTSFAALVGEEDSSDGSTDDGSDDSSDDDGSSTETHDLRLHASPDNDGDVPEVSVTVSGGAEFGDESESDTDRIESNDDGSTTMTSVGLDPDAIDTYQFTGEVVGVDLPSGYVVTATVDGDESPIEDLVDDSSSDDGTDDGSSDDGSTDDGSTDDGTIDDGSTDDGTPDGGSDDGSTDDGSDGGSTDDGTDDSDSSEELSNVLRIDGRNDESVVAYTATVSGDVQKDAVLSSGSATFDQFEDVARDGKVIGLVHEGIDVFRYSGTLERFTVDGNADVTFAED